MEPVGYHHVHKSANSFVIFRNMLFVNVAELLKPALSSSYRITPCRLSSTTYLIHLQLPYKYMEAFTLTWGSAMPW
jgi:hypothetical protein